MPEQTILVLGCGMGGVVAARELRRLLPGERVVVVDRAPRASLPLAYPALAVGEVRAGAIQRPREKAARRGLEFVNATVQHIDLENRSVRAEGRELRYDYLVIALGAELAPERIPGLAESGQGFYSFEAAERLGAALRYFSGGRILITQAEGPVRWPAAPYEMAMLLEHRFHRKKMRQKVEIAIAATDATPLATLGAEVSELIAGQLAHKGIEFIGNAGLTGVDGARHVVDLGTADARSFDLLIAVPPHAAPQVAVEAGLPDESGWITVAPATLETNVPGVFALGDIASLAVRSGRALMSGILAGNEARFVARQIASRIQGASPPQALKGDGRAFIEVGAGAAIMLSGDLLAAPDRLRVAQPSIVWHWAKAAAEKYWLYQW